MKPCPVFNMDLNSNATVEMLAERCMRSYENNLVPGSLREKLKFAMMASDGAPHYAFRLLQARMPRYRTVRFFCGPKSRSLNTGGLDSFLETS